MSRFLFRETREGLIEPHVVNEPANAGPETFEPQQQASMGKRHFFAVCTDDGKIRALLSYPQKLAG
jgi:hypothetical protein